VAFGIDLGKGINMKKLIIAAAIAAGAAAPAYALTHYLVSDWFANNGHFCRYDNGTVMNVGYRTCPLSIQG
jgi:hypothetical protein